MNRLFFILSLVFMFSSCSFFLVDEDRIRYNQWDVRHIPDKYNTGADENTRFKIVRDKENVEGVVIQNRVQYKDDDTVGTNQYQISSYQQIASMPDRVVIRDYDFSDKKFVVQNSDRYPITNT